MKRYRSAVFAAVFLLFPMGAQAVSLGTSASLDQLNGTSDSIGIVDVELSAVDADFTTGSTVFPSESDILLSLSSTPTDVSLEIAITGGVTVGHNEVLDLIIESDFDVIAPSTREIVGLVVELDGMADGPDDLTFVSAMYDSVRQPGPPLLFFEAFLLERNIGEPVRTQSFNGVSSLVSDLRISAEGSFPGGTATFNRVTITYQFDSPIPEPTSLALLGLGTLLVTRRQRAARVETR